MTGKNRGLGRGLEGLLSIDVNDPTMTIQEIALSEIVPNPNQPRYQFEEESLQELAASIRQHGVLQPIVLRPQGQHYQIVVGERRWRAAQLAEIATIPSIIRELNERNVAELSLIENLQREDLNPVEEARAYQRMLEEFGYTQEELAESVAKSRSYIANTVRLLLLPQEILTNLANKDLTVGHARALLALKNPDDQLKMANKVTKDKIPVRELEAILKQSKDGRGRYKRTSHTTSADLQNLEEKLQTALSTKVSIAGSGRRGIIRVEYYSEEELERLLDLWGVEL